jgi:hypothetical protein
MCFHIASSGYWWAYLLLLYTDHVVVKYWLGHYGKFGGSFPDEITQFFNLPNPSSRTRYRGLLRL